MCLAAWDTGMLYLVKFRSSCITCFVALQYFRQVLYLLATHVSRRLRYLHAIKALLRLY
jgi:hypothetical protein